MLADFKAFIAKGILSGGRRDHRRSLREDRKQPH